MFKLLCWGVAHVPKMLVMGHENGSILEKNQNVKKKEKEPKPNKIVDTLLHYLCMKQGSLVCFVCHAQISQTTMLHATLLIFSESSL
jgi:hypothetical protein